MTWGESGLPPLWGAAGKAGYMLACAVAALLLAVSGFSYFAVKDVAGIGGSHAIASGPSIGAQNILLMGLESRTDWDGNVLSPDILAAMHAGSVRGVTQQGVGGNATNTLILLHIPAGGGSVTGYSIPRDDWVTFAGVAGPQQQGKIDQAYGVSMYYTQERLRSVAAHLTRDQIAYLGNEAGRAATVATVEQLTGVHIDHFAEVNMVGFYDLAKVLGGVDVCLNHPVRDSYSGADFPAGYQHLYAAQALAFVRQRHGLQGGDLDRTRRQQAFLYAVLRQLSAEGTLGDLGRFRALLSVAQRYVITDSGWNLMDFASGMQALTSGNLVFRTLPVAGFGTIGHQDVNIVDTGRIKQIVRNGFYPPRPVSEPAPVSSSGSLSTSPSWASPSSASRSASPPASRSVSPPLPAGLTAIRPPLPAGLTAIRPPLPAGLTAIRPPLTAGGTGGPAPAPVPSRPQLVPPLPEPVPSQDTGDGTISAPDRPACVN